jgi:putative cell wall-binding protein
MTKMKKVAVLAIVLMVLTMLPVQLFAATADSTRLAGNDRIATGLDIASAGWTSADTVIVAPADQENLVDALAVAPLAGQENAPILVTFKNSLDPAVKAEITSLGAKKVYVVGAISDSVKNEIAAISGVTVEVLKGNTRWETDQAINAKLTAPAGTFVVGYNAIPDALSVASYAAKNHYAIVLADVNAQIPAGQQALGSKTYILGGSALVADITGATRIAGADRFETNTKVAQTLDFNYARVYVANGLSLVDALSVAPLAAHYSSFVALASATDVAAKSYVSTKISTSSQVIAVGGTTAVPDSVAGLIKAPNASSLVINSIDPVSLNSFKVVFNQPVDSDTAQRVSNYKVNGTALTSASTAVVLDDNQTVLVTVSKTDATFNQNASVTVEVNASSIYDFNKKTSVAGTTKTITLVDTTVPALDSVKAVGNAKLRVQFSEPVASPSVSDAGSWKLDGNTLSSVGLSNLTIDHQTTGAWIGTNEVDLYFASPIASGSHTLTVAKGSVGSQLSDQAGFVVPQSSKDFTVDAATGAPTVQSVSVENNTIYVTFDRAMYANYDSSASAQNSDTNSARNINNYTINDQNSSVASVEFKANSDYKVMKITANSGIIKTGTNVVELSKDIKDAFGNVLSGGSDNPRYTFTYAADTTKPTVTSVVALTATDVRVTFSKPVDYHYAETISNYTLKDSDGATLNITGAVTVPADTNSDTVELTVPALRGTGYSLKIKNICDTATNPNIMDTYTATFDGIDDLGPSMSQAIGATNASKVYVLFNEGIDSSSVVVDNFGYTDGASPAVQRDLPSGSSVSIDGSGKIVTVTFPDAYKIGAASADKYDITALRVSNVKDKAGNLLQGVSQVMAITAPGSVTDAYKPTLVMDSFNLFDNGDDIRAEFVINQELTSLVSSDFRVAGQTPDSGYNQGTKVVLNFTNQAAGGNVELIRAAGVNAQLTTVAETSTNIATVPVKEITGETVYNDQVAPRLLSVATRAGEGAGGTDDTYATDHTVLVLNFSEAIDPSIAGLYNDDFIATFGGTSVTLNTPTVKGSQVIYDLGVTTGGVPTNGAGLYVKAVSSKVDIRDMKDANKDYNVYVPSTDDVNGKTL